MSTTTITRHAVGDVVRIAGDTERHLGRIGEIVSDTGVWYRLRIDNGVVVLFRHANVEAVTDTAVAHALRVELRTMHVKSLKAMLDTVDEATEQEVVEGLRTALAQAREVLAAVEFARDVARLEQLDAELSALSWSRGRKGSTARIEATLATMYDRTLTEWRAVLDRKRSS